MANISITSECNRYCPYCFARGAFPASVADRPVMMAREDYKKALGFLERSGIDQVRLLGGEPTLHPDFTFFAGLAIERGYKLLVFSNGLMPDKAARYLSSLPEDRAAVLINSVLPEGPKDQYQQQGRIFKRLGSRVTLGLNLYRPGIGMDFLIEHIEKYGLSQSIRLGIAHPGIGNDNAHLKVRFYEAVGSLILQFAERAFSKGIDIEFDCGFVPCMFSGNVPENLSGMFKDVGRRCNPIIDIMPDLSIGPCYPLYNMAAATLGPDSEAASIRGMFEEKLKSYRTLGIFKECQVCRLKFSGECTGGCLAAATGRLNTSGFVLHGDDRSEIHFLQPPACDNQSKAPRIWVVPYVDQPMLFWHEIEDCFGDFIKEVYFPISRNIVGTGRPPRPDRYLEGFLKGSALGKAVLVNPMVFPYPVDEILPRVVDNIKGLHERYGIGGVTLSNLDLAMRIHKELPTLRLTASVVMDIALPQQAFICNEVFDCVVAASRIVRDVSALKKIKTAFHGRLRLIVNEGCLPGCLYRTQHFYEMGCDIEHPGSLCEGLLKDKPWLRLTGAWVLPQHLYLYDGLYDELKIAGRVTLKERADYLRVLDGYVNAKTLRPNAIGGGPASVLTPAKIEEEFFIQTLNCGRNCHECRICMDYYNTATGGEK